MLVLVYRIQPQAKARGQIWRSANQPVRLYQAYSMNPQTGTEMIVAPVTLEGRQGRLEPLSQAHHADLTAVWAR
jgi:hypothetical protein